jgi:hypothetical protein
VEQRLYPRPELFDYSLVVIGFMLYMRVARKFSHANMCLVMLLVLLWTNYHAGILAYVIFTGLFLDLTITAIRARDSKQFKTLLAYGLLFFTTGFVNKDLQHPIFYALNFSASWAFITEHQSSLGKVAEHQELIAFWLSGVVVTLWAIAVRQFGIAAVLLVFMLASVERTRMLSLSGVVIACSFILLSGNHVSREFARKMRPQVRRTVEVAGVLACGLLLTQLTWSAGGRHALEQDFPVAATEYLSGQAAGGNLLNPLHHGGYLIYQLDENFKVFIDGRTQILYPPEFFEEYIAISMAIPAANRAAAEKYDLDYVVWTYDKAMNSAIRKNLGKQAEYLGTHSVVYSSSGQLQQLVDVLLFPACLSRLQPSATAEWLAIVTDQRPRNDALINGLLQIAEQGGRVQTEEVLNELQSATPIIRSQIVRLLGHAMIDRKNYAAAVDFFSHLEGASSLDRIYLAYASLKANNLAIARSVLVEFMSGMWEFQGNIVTEAHRARIVRLVRALEDAGGSNAGTEALFEKWATAEERGTAASGLEDFVYRDHCESMISSGRVNPIHEI